MMFLSHQVHGPLPKGEPGSLTMHTGFHHGSIRHARASCVSLHGSQTNVSEAVKPASVKPRLQPQPSAALLTDGKLLSWERKGHTVLKGLLPTAELGVIQQEMKDVIHARSLEALRHRWVGKAFANWQSLKFRLENGATSYTRCCDHTGRSAS